MSTPELLRTKSRYIEQMAASMRPLTVRKYDYAIKEFIRFLDSSGIEVESFRDLRRADAERWLRAIAQRPMKSSSRAKKITYLRLFFERMMDWEWEAAPRERLFRMDDMPPEDSYLPRPLSPETDRLLKAELSRRNTLLSKALLFLRATGLRSQELLDLEVDSLTQTSRDHWTLRVPLGKLHSERVVPVDRNTAELFEELRELRGSAPPAPHPQTRKPTRYLLQRPDGRRYLYDVLRHYLRVLERQVRFPEHITLHRLRHTYATELLRAGMRLEVIMKLLGHRTLRMTLRYAAVSEEQVRGEYARALERLPGSDGLGGICPRGWTQKARGRSGGILRSLEEVVTRLESLRRDRSRGAERTRLARLIERARTLRHEISDLLSPGG